jgi:CheY-like chemotaxis protein
MSMSERPLVLTIDDNQTFLGILAVLLERLYFDVLPVTSARDALDLARVARPQVITLSMQMPDTDSLALIRELRADPELADLPVIMITGERDKQRVWEAMSLGCLEVLDKPLELNSLHRALQRCNLYPEGRRRYLRAPFPRPVEIIHQGVSRQLTGITLSERGILVRMPEPLPRGIEVEIKLHLPGEVLLPLVGQIIYGKGGQAGPMGLPPGVAIKFERLTIKDTERLHALVTDLLIGDIVATQCEPVIKPG